MYTGRSLYNIKLIYGEFLVYLYTCAYNIFYSYIVTVDIHVGARNSFRTDIRKHACACCYEVCSWPYIMYAIATCFCFILNCMRDVASI